MFNASLVQRISLPDKKRRVSSKARATNWTQDLVFPPFIISETDIVFDCWKFPFVWKEIPLDRKIATRLLFELTGSFLENMIEQSGEKQIREADILVDSMWDSFPAFMQWEAFIHLLASDSAPGGDECLTDLQKELLLAVFLACIQRVSQVSACIGCSWLSSSDMI